MPLEAPPADTTSSTRSCTTPPRHERWLWLGVLALLIHVPLLYWLGAVGQDEVLVQVVEMSPSPDGELRLGDDAPLRIDLRLSLAADSPAPSPLGARLFHVAPDGTRELVALGRVDPDDHGHLIFESERREGSYLVWLAAAGPTPLLGGAPGGLGQGQVAFALDGELLLDEDGDDAFPSGDGKPGGDFVAVVRVVDKPPETSVVAANIVSEVPEPEPSTEGDSAEPVDAPPAPALEAETPPEEPPATQPEPSRRAARVETTPTPPRPEPEVVRPPLVDNELPQPDRPLPNKDAEISDLFEAGAADLDGIIGDEADAMARALEDERARSGPLAGWEEDLARTQGTFNGNGPRVRPGNQQAVSTHRKEIFEYIAMMHKGIHRDWADTYLINLDLMQRGPTNPINDPNLRTVLEIEMAEEGTVSDVQIVASSGVQTYDAEAIRIAWESGPREPVPESMLSPNRKSYLHWSFHRDQRQCGTFGVEVFLIDEDGTRDSVRFDQDKVLAEEERIGVRREPRGGAAVPLASEPPQPATGVPAHTGRHAAQGDHAGHGHDEPARHGGDDETAAAAEPDDDHHADAPAPVARPQQRKRQVRPQTRKRSAE